MSILSRVVAGEGRVLTGEKVRGGRKKSMRNPPKTLRAVTLGGADPLHDRRRDTRRPVQMTAMLHVTDALGGSSSHEILTRDQSLSGTSFMLKEPLAVSTICRIDIRQGPGQGKSYEAEVVRARGISNGRYEIAVRFRKQL
jgi:hypothetical protein